ncbi:MAG: hypothetical protein ABL974_11880 [Prosthecobacter sp.]
MTTTLTPLTDFSDRLSPMVVKELRQGLRTRSFGSTMLGMHVLLILITLITGSSPNTDETRWMLDALATLVLCLIMPFRVSNALAEEVKMNTLDMLMLTRLSCSRIVFGKWASVALQSLLIALSLMPYVVARYVFGGIDLMLELNMLALKWLVGIVIAALLVALSTIQQSWLRLTIILVPMIFGGFGVVGLMVSTISGRSIYPGLAMGSGLWGVTIVGTLLATAWAIFACLSLAASRISSPAAPLAWLKRCVHLVAFFIPLLIALFTRQEFWLTGAYIVAGFMTLDAMTETQNEVPSAYVPFFKRGLMGRMMMRVLTPGWASGFWLTLVAALCLGGALAAITGPEVLPYHILVCSTIWMVTAGIQILPTRRSNDLLPLFICGFALVQLLAGMFTGLGVIVAKSASEQPLFLALLPPSAIMGADSIPSGAPRKEFLMIAMLCAAVWPLLMATLSVLAWRKLRPVRGEAKLMAA